jgi:hypothetical protein
MPISKHRRNTDEQKFNVKLEWLKEQGADLRARTQAEYLFTAAALAFYGGYAGESAQHPNLACPSRSVLSSWLCQLVGR